MEGNFGLIFFFKKLSRKLYFIFQISFKKYIAPWQRAKIKEVVSTYEMERLQQARVRGFAQIIPKPFPHRNMPCICLRRRSLRPQLLFLCSLPRPPSLPKSQMNHSNSRQLPDTSALCFKCLLWSWFLPRSLMNGREAWWIWWEVFWKSRRKTS